jgi:putative restriction endonuclease
MPHLLGKMHHRWKRNSNRRKGLPRFRESSVRGECRHFFRDAVLISYENRCALSEIAMSDLLNASHIIPWKVEVERRADPRNGIALNVLYDRAFDRGLITFDTSLRVVLSQQLAKAAAPPPLHRHALLALEGRKLRLPKRFAPDPEAMAYHREHVFSDR